VVVGCLSSACSHWELPFGAVFRGVLRKLGALLLLKALSVVLLTDWCGECQVIKAVNALWVHQRACSALTLSFSIGEFLVEL